MNSTEHLLSCLAEECTEVGQRVSKALRFGLSEVQPGQPLSNAERIRAELIDLMAIWGMLGNEGIVKGFSADDFAHVSAKMEKVEKFMAYARECGALTDGAGK